MLQTMHSFIVGNGSAKCSIIITVQLRELSDPELGHYGMTRMSSLRMGRSNATTPAILRKTALRGSIRSYYEFATDRAIQTGNAGFAMHTVTSSCA